MSNSEERFRADLCGDLEQDALTLSKWSRRDAGRTKRCASRTLPVEKAFSSHAGNLPREEQAYEASAKTALFLTYPVSLMDPHTGNKSSILRPLVSPSPSHTLVIRLRSKDHWFLSRWSTLQNRKKENQENIVFLQRNSVPTLYVSLFIIYALIMTKKW